MKFRNIALTFAGLVAGSGGLYYASLEYPLGSIVVVISFTAGIIAGWVINERISQEKIQQGINLNQKQGGTIIPRIVTEWEKQKKYTPRQQVAPQNNQAPTAPLTLEGFDD